MLHYYSKKWGYAYPGTPYKLRLFVAYEHLALTLARQTRFTYPGGMVG